MQMNIFDKAAIFQDTLIGNQSTPFMKRVNTVIYNTCMRAQQDVRINNLNWHVYAIPAGTGSGKSTFTCGLIAALHEVDDDYTAAFITNTIQEAQSAYNNLSELMGDEVVYLHSTAHSSNKIKEVKLEHGEVVAAHLQKFGQSKTSELKNHRIIVCTHKLWVKEGQDGSDLGIRLFKSESPRTNIFIDEQPDLTESFQVSLSDITYLHEQAVRTPDNLDVIKVLEMVYRRMKSACDIVGAKFDAISIISRTEFEKTRTIEPSKLESGASRKRIEITLKFLENASLGNCFLDRGHYKREAVKGVRRKLNFIAYELSFHMTPGTIILDATANYSALTELHPRIELIEVPSIDYQNIVLTHIEAPSQYNNIAARTTTKETDSEYILFARHLVVENSDPGEEVLVVFHKRLMALVPDLETHRNRKIHYCQWGAGIGSNRWRNCTSVFLLSEYHLPRSVYLADTLAIQEMSASSGAIKSALGQRLVGPVKKVADGHRMRWFKQMATRGCVRNSDKDGICGSMKLFTTMDKSLFVECFPVLFPNAREPKFLLSDQVERKSKPAKLEAYLSGYIETELCVAEIAEYFNWDVKVVGRAFKSKTCEFLRGIGWQLIPGNGKASKPILKKTPYHFNAGPFKCVL